MVSVSPHVVLNGLTNTFLHPIRVLKRFFVAAATMVFGQPDIRHTFCFAEFRVIVNGSTIAEFFAMWRCIREHMQAMPNTLNVLVGAAFVELDHFGCWLRVGRHSFDGG